MARLSMMVACSNNRVIGIDNQLPWRLPSELQYFKSVTMHKPIIMGRVTFDSLRKPLPGRTNIVLTKNKNYHAEGIELVHTLDEAIALGLANADQKQLNECIIIGGDSIYRMCLPKVERIYLTQVDAEMEGDAFFPELDMNQWSEISRETVDERDKNDQFAYTKIVLDRIEK